MFNIGSNLAGFFHDQATGSSIQPRPEAASANSTSALLQRRRQQRRLGEHRQLRPRQRRCLGGLPSVFGDRAHTTSARRTWVTTASFRQPGQPPTSIRQRRRRQPGLRQHRQQQHQVCQHRQQQHRYRPVRRQSTGLQFFAGGWNSGSGNSGCFGSGTNSIGFVSTRAGNIGIGNSGLAETGASPTPVTPTQASSTPATYVNAGAQRRQRQRRRLRADHRNTGGFNAGSFNRRPPAGSYNTAVIWLPAATTRGLANSGDINTGGFITGNYSNGFPQLAGRLQGLAGISQTITVPDTTVPGETARADLPRYRSPAPRHVHRSWLPDSRRSPACLLDRHAVQCRHTRCIQFPEHLDCPSQYQHQPGCGPAR